jgi:hypothetical protein
MRYTLKSRFILLLVAVLFATCYDDETYYFSGRESRRDTTEEVASARQWYGANVEELSLKSDGNDGLQLNVMPRWEEAVVNSNVRTTRVEIPVTMPGSFHFMPEENYRKYEAGDERYAMSLTRLVIQTNRRTGRQIGFLMTASPSAKCLEETDFNPFDKLWYMNIPRNYGGHIVYHDLSGKFVNGWEYRNGKVKHAIHRHPDNESNGDIITRSMSSGYDACYIVRENTLWQICIDYYSASGVYQGYQCTYEWEITDEYSY